MQVMRDHPNPRRRPHLGIWCRSIRHRRAISAHQRPPSRARRRSPQRAADPGQAPLSRMTRARPIRRTWMPSGRALARTNVAVSMTASTWWSVSQVPGVRPGRPAVVGREIRESHSSTNLRRRPLSLTYVVYVVRRRSVRTRTRPAAPITCERCQSAATTGTFTNHLHITPEAEGGRSALSRAGALEAVRRLAGSSAAILTVTRLQGGQHADTWRIDTEHPAFSAVVRQFPVADSAGGHEQRVLRTLDGLGGLAPVLLGGDLSAQWSEHPTSVISSLDGHADITPTDPERWAHELGCALAVVHALPSERLAGLPSVFDHSGSSQDALNGPLAAEVRSHWVQVTAAPEVLTHSDYWSGNIVWRDGRLTGIVDWSGGARGPRGFDLGWCRLDLVLLFDEQIADVFLRAYEAAIARPIGDMVLWDGWAVARSHDGVETWVPNYAPLGRTDLDKHELRRRHSRWTTRLLEQTLGHDR